MGDDYFDDELKSMEELMREDQITLSEKTFQVPLSTLSLKTPMVVATGTSVEECIRILSESHIGCVLVLENNKLRGILTERDILLKIVGKVKDITTVFVDKFMTPDPKILSVNDSIDQALRLMNQGGYRHVPIVDEKSRPVTIVSIKDIVSYIVEFFPQDVLNLPPHPIHIGAKHREGG